MRTDPARRTKYARMILPATAALIGIAYLVAGLTAGNVRFGVIGLLITVACSVVLVLLGRHSETVDGLLSRRDERINALDREANLFAGSVVMLAVLVMFVVEVARGRDGSPYFQLAALWGISYLVALVVLRLRR